MQRVTSDRAWPLHDVAATRAVEHAAAKTLPAHTLMQRAGLATARLALAIAPHARVVWVACGPGNNGGDGFEAAMHLQRWGKRVVVSHVGDPARLPPDAAASLRRARETGVAFAPGCPDDVDLAIDGLLGIGSRGTLDGDLLAAVERMNALAVPVLAIDIPSGLDADTGTGASVHASCTLSLLALKPGLFTARGRDACGDVWFDDLAVQPAGAATATLSGPPASSTRAHDSHKGSFGDVAVIGGAGGMAGAALLAASAALHGGAGRVFVGLLDPQATGVSPQQPELMLRDPRSIDLAKMSVACGCGGGEAVRAILPQVLDAAPKLVLDADALNAVAGDAQLAGMVQARTGRGQQTLLTPHPLEAARLLSTTAADVQADRLHAAKALAGRFGCVVLLKGSGTVIAAPGSECVINATGNARLATAGTGDVLAGLAAARLAQGEVVFDAACSAAWLHGDVADRWPTDSTLTAGGLAARLGAR